MQSARQQLQMQADYRRFLNRLVSAHVEANSYETIPESVFDWKGAVTLRQQAYRELATNERLAPYFRDLQAVSRQMSAVTSHAPIPPAKETDNAAVAAYATSREIWGKRFTELNQRYEDLAAVIARESEPFREIREPFTEAALQKLLPLDTAFVDFLEYWHYRPVEKPELRYLAVVVNPDRDAVVISLASAEKINEWIGQFRLVLSQENLSASAREQAKQAAAKLREQVWQPIEEHLADVKTVIISPDSQLGTIPFAALPGRKGENYLLEEYRLATIPMVRLLPRLFGRRSAKSDSAQGGLFVLGGVSYDGQATSAPSPDSLADTTTPRWLSRSAPTSKNTKWQSLPGFQEELSIVQDLFKKKFKGERITTLRGMQATETEFIRAAPRHAHLHVITHGFFADPNYESLTTVANQAQTELYGGFDQTRSALLRRYQPGLLCGLALAGANHPPLIDNPETDGILTASEIETLPLKNVDLVVLSACETGLGATAGGEGLLGLQRAFHVAGARSCLASLWKVDDSATQELMRRFYYYYWEKEFAKIDALRQAQLDLLHNPELITRQQAQDRGNVRPLPKKIVDKTSESQTLSPALWAAFVLSGDWR